MYYNRMKEKRIGFSLFKLGNDSPFKQKEGCIWQHPAGRTPTDLLIGTAKFIKKISGGSQWPSRQWPRKKPRSRPRRTRRANRRNKQPGKQPGQPSRRRKGPLLPIAQHLRRGLQPGTHIAVQAQPHTPLRRQERLHRRPPAGMRRQRRKPFPKPHRERSPAERKEYRCANCCLIGIFCY